MQIINSSAARTEGALAIGVVADYVGFREGLSKNAELFRGRLSMSSLGNRKVFGVVVLPLARHRLELDIY